MLASTRGQLGIDPRDPLAGRDGRGLERGDGGSVRVRAASDRLADRLRRLVALGLEPVALGQELAPAPVGRERLVDERGVLALVDRPLADGRGVVAQPLQPDAHARASVIRLASRSRSRTKCRLEAGQHPAGARPVRSPEEREVDRAERPSVRQATLGGDREDQRLPGVAGARAGPLGGVAERGEVGALVRIELGRHGGQAVAADDDPERLRRVRREPGPRRADPLGGDLDLARGERRSLLRAEQRGLDRLDLDERRDVAEARPVRGGLAGDVGVGRLERVAEDRLGRRRQAALDLAARRSPRPAGRTRRTGAGSRRSRRDRTRSRTAGAGAGRAAGAARAGRPRRSGGPRRRGPSRSTSCGRRCSGTRTGTLSGGSRSKTSRAIVSARSRDPPAVERSLPHGSIVTPKMLHWAAHSRFQPSLPRPPNGLIQPDAPQPWAHVTRFGRHS